MLGCGRLTASLLAGCRPRGPGSGERGRAWISGQQARGLGTEGTALGREAKTLLPFQEHPPSLPFSVPLLCFSGGLKAPKAALLPQKHASFMF